MADHQINTPDSSQPEPLSLTDFAASLYHAERADNFFKFLKNFYRGGPLELSPGIVNGRLGDAIDDSSTDALARFVEQGQVAAYIPTQTPAPFRPDYPDAPFLLCASRFGSQPWHSLAQERYTWTTRNLTILPNSLMSRRSVTCARPPSASLLYATSQRRRRKSACAPARADEPRRAEGYQRDLPPDPLSRASAGGSNRRPGAAQLLLSRADQYSPADAGERAAVGADAQGGWRGCRLPDTWLTHLSCDRGSRRARYRVGGHPNGVRVHRSVSP